MNARHAMFKAYLAAIPSERDQNLLHCNDEALEQYYMNYASLDHHYKVNLNDSMLVVVCDKKGCNLGHFILPFMY